MLCQVLLLLWLPALLVALPDAQEKSTLHLDSRKESAFSFCKFYRHMKVALEGMHKITVVIFVGFTCQRLWQ